MPYRMQVSKRPIQSIKHIIDDQQAIAAGVQIAITLAQAVDNPVLANGAEVQKGSRINALYLNVQVRGTAAAGVLGNVYMFLFKNPGTNIPSVPNGNVLGVADEKRQVFHQEMRMLSDGADSIPVTLFQGVIRVPKVFRTMRMSDTISCFVFSPSGTEVCLQCIYKEYQ